MKATGATVDDVKTVIVHVLGIEDRAPTLDASTPLFGGIPELDSLAVIELVANLENQFGIEFEDSDISGETFETIGSLADNVERHLASH